MFFSMMVARLALAIGSSKLWLAAGAGFLGHGPSSTRFGSRSAEVQEAMASILRCGSAVVGSENAAAERELEPIWQALPKGYNGRVDWRQLRYLTHRYFSQQSSFLILGLEPARQVNTSNLGAADILSNQVPALLEVLLDKEASTLGYSFDDAVATVVALEHLILNSETAVLEKVYRDRHLNLGDQLSEGELRSVLEEYMVHWMLDEGFDAETMTLFISNHTLLAESVPHWADISSFVHGAVTSMSFARQHSLQAPAKGKGGALTGQFSFEDASLAIAGMSKHFASFWETECQVIKASLVELDRSATGRVKLSDFYGANADGEWRFGESQAYLREVGALDESSTWRGPEVIIPNYLQAACNCIVARPHYLVCCVNECEGILGDLERTIGAPVAGPGEILEILSNMSNYDDEPVNLDKALRTQLEGIAATHGGRIPLHGRLFAQWLHYVFPRECPFPHRSGTVSSMVTPTQYGEASFVTDEEMERHVSAGQIMADDESASINEWMSQWNQEEELVGDYSRLRDPWADHLGHGAALLSAVVVAFLALRSAAESSASCALVKGCASGLPKAHFV